MEKEDITITDYQKMEKRRRNMRIRGEGEENNVFV